MALTIINRIRSQGLKSWLNKIKSILIYKYYINLTKNRNWFISVLGKKNPIHFGVLGYKNAGDTSLFEEVEHCFSRKFSRRDLHRGEVSIKEIEKINKKNDYLVLGGGGLFLMDTNANQNSNWQFNIKLDNLDKIKIPLIIFAVGYNKFRGQEEFGSLFETHLRKTIETASFVGIRNKGSMKALKDYLPREFGDKLIYQPCPTTIIRYHHPKFVRNINIQNSKERIIAINIAFDRTENRFQGRKEEILDSIIKFSRSIKEKGWKVIFVGHVGVDRKIIPYLEDDFEYVDLTTANHKRILRFYAPIAITIGMRGHAQMIPFGLGNPIISLISHNKLAWFLEDMDANDLGIEIKSENLDLKLLEKVEYVFQNFDSIKSRIEEQQKILRGITDSNVKLIEDLINTSESN